MAMLHAGRTTKVSRNCHRFHCEVKANGAEIQRTTCKFGNYMLTVDSDKVQGSRISRAVGLNIFMPRKVVDKNLVLNYDYDSSIRHCIQYSTCLANTPT